MPNPTEAPQTGGCNPILTKFKNQKTEDEKDKNKNKNELTTSRENSALEEEVNQRLRNKYNHTEK